MFGRELAGRQLTRKELHPLLPTTDFPRQGEVVGHLLLLAELAGLICSGRPRPDGEHTYALVDEVVGPAPVLDREEAIARLVRGFVAGHGPTSVRDVTRWVRLNAGEVKRALGSGGLESGTVDGVDLWWLPGRDHGVRGAWLLPMFDEAYLSHDAPRFERPSGHPFDTRHVSASEAGGGVVIVDGRDVGVFRRRLVRGRLTVRLFLAAGARASDLDAAHVAARRLGDHLGLPAEVQA